MVVFRYQINFGNTLNGLRRPIQICTRLLWPSAALCILLDRSISSTYIIKEKSAIKKALALVNSTLWTQKCNLHKYSLSSSYIVRILRTTLTPEFLTQQNSNAQSRKVKLLSLRSRLQIFTKNSTEWNYCWLLHPSRWHEKISRHKSDTGSRPT